MKKKRSKLNIILAIALALSVATVAVGLTVAYLSYVPAPKTNHFTIIGSDKILAQIDEKFDDKDALQATPGDLIQKEVNVQNISSAPDPGIDEWIALVITFTNGGNLPADGDAPAPLTPTEMTDLLKVATTNYESVDNTTDPATTTNMLFNANDWIRDMNFINDPSGDPLTTPLQQTEVFYYKWKVPQGGSTTDLISNVKFLDTAINSDIQTVAAMNGFVLNITGTVIQGDIEGQGTATDPYGPNGPLINSDVEAALMTQIQDTILN